MTDNFSIDDNAAKDEELFLFTKLFQEFDKTSLNLKKQYGDLQSKVENLLLELDQKNAYLNEVFKKQEETNNLLYTILSNLSGGVIVYDINFNVIIINKKASQIAGVRKEDVEGESYLSIFCDKQNISYIENVFEKQKNGDYFLEEEFIVKNKLGEAVPVFIRTSTLMDQDDEITGYIHVFDDLTKMKSMEEDARKNKNLMELGQMAAGIAHEIRNPLGGISGFTTMLSRDLADDEEKLELVEKIQSGIKTLNKITTAVLSFHRPVSLNIMSFQIQKIIDSVLDLLESDLVNNNIDYEIKRDYTKTSIDVSIDVELLKQSLLNILKNSVQAVESGKRVEIIVKFRLNILKNNYFIQIIDNGVGISDEEQKKLFTPFHTTKAEGTGLGLVMVKKIIESLKGKIELKSKPGKGTSLKLTLPIKGMIN